MLEKVKTALRIKTTALDSEITDLIQAALKDLEIAGVSNKNHDDPLIGPRSNYILRGVFGTGRPNGTNEGSL